MIPTIVISAVLTAIVGGIICRLVREARSGRGGCAGCGYAGACAAAKLLPKKSACRCAEEQKTVHQ